MLRIDLARREISASVRDLAAPPGDFRSAGGMLAGLRADLGVDVHRRYRRAREGALPGFRGEVSVAFTHAVDEFTVHLHGRVDGLVEEADGGRLRVEEVKSVAAPASVISSWAPRDVHRAALQARLYAFILACTRRSVEVRARLVLVSVLDGSEHTLAVPFDAARTERALNRVLRRHVTAAREREELGRVRGLLAGRLHFPYATPRRFQRELCEQVEHGLAAGRPVIVEAPTGIGKTVAALLPGLRAALERNAVLLYTTAKRTQRALVAETFRDLAAASDIPRGELRALTLRPRVDMCPTGRLVCHVDHCALLANLHDGRRRERVLAELGNGRPLIAPDDVLAAGVRAELCPHLLSLMLCARVDLVIGDYNHLYGSTSPPGLFPGEVAPRPVLAIIDEAHNLFDRAREYDSPFLDREQLEDLVRRHPPPPPAPPSLFDHVAAPPDAQTIRDDLGSFFRAVRDVVDRTLERALEFGQGSVDDSRPAQLDADDWSALAGRAARLAVGYLHLVGPTARRPGEDPVLDVLATVARIRDLLSRGAESLVPYARSGRGKGQRGVGICCVDPAPRLSERHRQMVGTVAMSATLSPPAHYREALGFADLDPVEISLPSPFPARHRRVLVVPTVSTTWRERSRHYGAIARCIETVAASTPGHYVAFFPSFGFLEEVHAHLAVPSSTLLVQRPRMPDSERADVLERMRDDAGSLLLLAVTGGVFAEGVDLPGDALVGAIVVGPALPQVGFERDAMRRYHEERHGDGFARAMLYPGMQRVIQAAGRVHRTDDDRGVIVLLDRRFARSPYAECLPEYWHGGDPRDLVTADPEGELRSFWRAQRESPTTWV